MIGNIPEYREKQDKIIYLFTAVGVISTTSFGILNLYDGKFIIGLIEIILSSLALLNVIFYKKTKNFEITATNILILVYLVLIFLIKTGGFKGNGIYWIYVFPLLTFFLKDKKTAFIWNLIFVFSAFILLVLSSQGIISIAYSSYALFEAIGSYLATMFLAYFYADALLNLIEKLNYRAIYDPLTKLYNRQFVLDYLDREIEKIKRGLKNKICVVYIDLDNFKYVNDKYGHTVGDEVLKKVAKIFLKNFRKTDIVGRVGGDEILIIVNPCDNKSIENKINLIKKMVEQELKKYNISLSYGIVLIPNETLNLEKAIKLADKRMYENKIKKKRLR